MPTLVKMDAHRYASWRHLFTKKWILAHLGLFILLFISYKNKNINFVLEYKLP